MRVISELSTFQLQELHALYQNEWWTKGRTLEETQRVVAGSQICIGLVDEAGKLVPFYQRHGFADDAGKLRLMRRSNSQGTELR